MCNKYPCGDLYSEFATSLENIAPLKSRTQISQSDMFLLKDTHMRTRVTIFVAFHICFIAS